MSGIGLARTTVELLDPAYTTRLADLERQVDGALLVEEARVDRLSDKSTSIVLAEQYDALVEEAKRTVTVQAFPRRKWGDAKEEHPPREDNREDKRLDVNRSTFFDAVMPESVVEPADLDLENLSAADWDKLCTAVWVLNERGVGVPKYSLASALRQRMFDDSEVPEPSASAPAGSQAGSREKSKSSGTTRLAGSRKS